MLTPPRRRRIFPITEANQGGRKRETKMFTTDNTEGYTIAQIAAFNAELAAILAGIPESDIEAREAAESAFADAVAQR
jgi:hypothetical protein